MQLSFYTEQKYKCHNKTTPDLMLSVSAGRSRSWPGLDWSVYSSMLSIEMIVTFWRDAFATVFWILCPCGTWGKTEQYPQTTWSPAGEGDVLSLSWTFRIRFSFNLTSSKEYLFKCQYQFIMYINVEIKIKDKNNFDWFQGTLHCE